SKGFSSKMQLDEAQAQLNLAKANVQLAEANLAKTVIRAPFDGTAGIRKVSLGDYVSPGEVLVNLDQTEKLKLQFTIPERYLSEIKAGSEVEFAVDAQGSVFRSTVDAIESRISAQNRSIQVQAIVDNVDNQLYPGQFVNVTLPIAKREAAVLVPDQALVPMGNKTFVFKVADGKAQKIEVQPGLRANSKAEIVAGLAAGDVVVTAGQQKLQDGASVRVSEPTAVSVTRMNEEAEPKAQ
ncbi:MAG: efflux RND transporter periplasmic adaptor subunit, partial [Alphaproteobacteria bacterium]|nr:efflux RND transporter periplasmic adaptor subunit [Alphaproteobacteria bacterium]